MPASRTSAAWWSDLRMHLSRRLNRSLAPPDRVSLNLTLRCNLSCTMCTTCYDSPELSTEEVKGIIDQTSAWGVKVFNPLGGEPFMRADIEELLAYAVRRGFYVSVTTNGTLITTRRARSVAAVPADRLHFNISLDGDAESNDLVRGPGMWRRAVDGYLRLREADAEAGNARRKLLANTLLHAGNLDHFEAVLEEQAALGFDGVQILSLFRVGPDAAPAAKALHFGPSHRGALEALIGRLIARVEAQPAAGYRIQNTVEELALIPKSTFEALSPLEAPCWAGWKELYINADGKAIMCDGKLDFLNGAFGDVRSQTLRQLWQSPELAARREVVKACTTPCVQTCYLRGSSDSGAELAVDGLKLLGDRGRQLSGRALTGRWEEAPDATLTVELSDVCPCDLEGCPTPPRRWAALTAGLPRRPTADTWGELRDHGHLNFGRGFLGFDVLRSVVDDLVDQRLRFGRLALRWRGEPLLHPEAAPILRWLGALAPSRRPFGRLALHTDGRFLTDELVDALRQIDGLDVILDLDRGDGAGLGALLPLVEGRAEGAGALPRARLLLLEEGAAERGPRPLAALGERPAPLHFGGGGVSALAALSAPVLRWLRAPSLGDPVPQAEAQAAHLRAAAAAGAPLVAPDPRRCGAPAAEPTLSWDGKLTLCPADTALELVVGSVTPGSLAGLWRGRSRRLAVEQATRGGRPERPRCRGCARPGWCGS